MSKDAEAVDDYKLTAQIKADAEADLPAVPVVVLVMIAIIQGYTLIGPLQHDFKVAMNIGDTGMVANVFTQAAALVQWGKFLMTLGQNVVLAHLSPLTRVYLAMAGIMVGAAIPPLFVFGLGSHWMGWVFLSFGLIGLSLGVFECTFLNVITPLGPKTKCWAITGFPAAFAIINVIGLSIVSFGMPVAYLFWYIVACIPLGAAIFAKVVVPRVGDSARSSQKVSTASDAMQKTAAVWDSVKDWSTWLPMMIPFMLVNVVGHFVMEGALPANFNTFNAHEVPLFGREDEHLINQKRFFVVFFICVGLGDIGSRQAGYWLSLSTYKANMTALLVGLACSILGMYLTTLGIGVVAWLSAFLAFAGQGFNYAVASKFIDRFVPRQHNLAAYSFWMFLGSAGAIAGSTMVDIIRYWICHGESYEHECMRHHH